MRGPARWWRGKSTPAKVETYTRSTFHFFAVLEIAAVGLTGFGQVELWLAVWLLLMVGVHGVVCAVTASRALDWTRGRREQPVRLLWTLGAITAAVACSALAIAEYGPGGEGVDGAAGGVFGVVLIFGAGTLALGVRNRRRVYALVGGFGAGAGAMSLALGSPGAALGATLAVLFGSAVFAFTSAFSVWLLNAFYELDEARETRARLAVAEERLRFGRDLHDVMGRNLAVIALKSELAVQLARRGRAESVDQMIEVQRIARESQREVRDVVRGYREADLGVELAGAHGVLTAAGIRCEVTGGEVTGLPAAVQSALAWAVREATTNVLRHGDAGWCAVGVREREGRVVLTVENDGASVPSGASGNDGAPVPCGAGGNYGAFVSSDDGAAVSSGAGGNDRASLLSGSGGSGLAGLRERLAAVEGTLEAGPVDGGLFRVVAEVPLITTGASEVMA
ncbi:sensor histidine kinase [Streptomyces sp. NPDC058676]|uniref:sensor histidine kinase n=1 Tax=unclassified Streptomyces TaxID=2593676 RepID=UPI00364F389C